jgi:sterol desaturase/sphingolipid hydroxylase (fatty acid hydroxylase superfamily)
MVFVACAIPCFVVLERLLPRQRMAIRWRAIALATLLLVANTLVGRMIPHAVPATMTPARILLAWATTELGWYWLHRAMHRVPLLWRVHRMHHADVPLAWHQSWWIHPLDIALFGSVAALSTWLAGAPLTAAPWLLLVRRAWGILLHANVAWPATWVDHVLVTPAVHHRHHREELRPANFAPSFAILDRVFGTWAR